MKSNQFIASAALLRMGSILYGLRPRGPGDTGHLTPEKSSER